MTTNRKSLITTVLILGALIALAVAPLTAQTIKAVRFYPPATSWDTTDHLDVQVKHGVQLNVGGMDSTGHRIPNEPIRWFVVDSTVAKVSATGLVTGVHRGQVDVGAEVGAPGHSMHGLLLVCVNDVARSPLTFTTVPDTTFLVAMPAKPDSAQRAAIAKENTTQLAASDPRPSAPAWDASCVHWRSTKPGVATINRRGLVTTKAAGTTGVVATVGPQRP